MSLYEKRGVALLQEETWRNIPGHEGYQVSNLGRVRSIDRVIEVNHPRFGKFNKTLKGKILKPAKYCKSGHVSLPLGRNTNGIPVHQLVLLAFVGPCPEGKEVLHNNGKPTDNTLENLSYGTRTENILDVYQHKGRWRKLTVDDVRRIRELLNESEKGSEIARKFNVSQSVISSIKYNKTYWWVNDE